MQGMMTSLSNAPVQATENRGEVKSDELRLGLPHWGSAVVAGGGKVGGRTRALVTRRLDSGSPTAFQAISSRERRLAQTMPKFLSVKNYLNQLFGLHSFLKAQKKKNHN